MKDGGSRVSGIAGMGAAALVLMAACASAWAGEVADKAAEAESLLSAGKISDALNAFDASTEAFWKAVPLGFRKAIFVDEVKGFGDYAAHPGSAFASKSDLKIYAEPVGFGWVAVDGGHRIAFKADIEIRDDKGIILAKSGSPVLIEKISHSPSHDFHMTVRFPLPDLKPGSYKLILKMTDEATGKTAPIELPLTIS